MGLPSLLDLIACECNIPIAYNVGDLQDIFITESFNDFPLDIFNRIFKVYGIFMFEKYTLSGDYYIQFLREGYTDYIKTYPLVYTFEDDTNPFTKVGDAMEILDLDDGEYEKVLHVNEETLVYQNIGAYNKEGTTIKCNFKIITEEKHFNILLFLDDAGGFNVLDIKWDAAAGQYYRPGFGYIADPTGVWHSLEIKRGHRPSDDAYIWQVFWNGELIYTSVRDGGASQIRFGWWSEYLGGGGGANTGAEFYLDNYSIETSFQEELSSLKIGNDWVNERKGNQYKGVRVNGNIRSNPDAYWLAIDDTATNISSTIKEFSFPQLLTPADCKYTALALLEIYKNIRPNYRIKFNEGDFSGVYLMDYGHRIKFSMTNPTDSIDELITDIKYVIEYPEGQYLIELQCGTGDTTPLDEFADRFAQAEEDLRILKNAYSGRTEYKVRQIIRDEDQVDLKADLNNYLLIADLETTPTNGATTKAPNSDWAYKVESEALIKAGVLTLTSSPIVKVASGNIAMQKADGTEIFKISHNDTNTTLLSTAGNMILTAKAGSVVVVESVSHDGGAVSGVTTLSMNNQLTNSLADGTAPMVITSTTKVTNLNADKVDGADLETTWTNSDTKICSSKAMKTKVDALISAAVGDTEQIQKIVRKTSDKPTSNDATVNADDELFFALEANASYVFTFYVFYNAHATPDINLQLHLTSENSYELRYGATSHYMNNTGDTAFFNFGGTSDDTNIGNSDASSSYDNSWVEIHGSIKNGNSANTLTLYWAQRSSNAQATIVYKGSYLTYQKIT
jgi:hypothetical protein